MKYYLATLVLLITSANALAGVALSDVALVQNKHPIKTFHVYLDELNHHSAQSIQSVAGPAWRKFNNGQLNLGYTSATAWIRFELANTQDQASSALLDITYPLLDYVTIYKKEQLRLRTLLSSGDARPFDHRVLPYRNFVLPIELKEKTNQIFYIEVKSNAPIQTELLLWEPIAFEQHYRQLLILDFMYYGFILCAAFIALSIAYFTGSRLHIIYGLYALSLSLTIASQQALLFQYIIPDSPQSHNWLQLFLSCTTTALAASFCLLFLSIPSASHRGKILRYLILIPLIVLVLSPLIGYAYALKAAILASTVTLIACFIMGVISHNIGDKTLKEQSSVFLLAWSTLLIGTIAFILSKLGYLPFNELSNRFIQISSLIELIIFAIALARRINRDQEQRYLAQASLKKAEAKSANFQKQLLNRATHNSITGLPNQALFESWLDNIIKKKTQKEIRVALVLISRMDEIVKTLGHAMAGNVSEVFATRLNMFASQYDEVLNIESTEGFYVANTNIGEFAMAITNTKETLHILDKLLEALDDTIHIDDIDIHPIVHIGFSDFPEFADTASTLIRQSNIALESSITRSLPIQRYDSRMDTYNHRRLALLSDLKKAIASDQLELYYQPILTLPAQNICAAEALVRWPHPKYGLIMPGEFIDIAERFGVIKQLTPWVLQQAIKQVTRWQELNIHCPITINISTLNLRDSDFVALVEEHLQDSPIISQSLTFEITETQMMQDVEIALKNIWKLHELGVKIAIDDFGTGHSSLAYLSRLPACKLKIDRSFIINLADNPKNLSLVRTTINIAHELNLEAVAEGVENEAIVNILTQLKCDYYQGYFFSKPQPLSAFEELLVR